jgi:hypothetical protein
MQKLGTDCMREHFGNQHWVEHMKLRLDEHKGVCVVISDIRFLNEAAFVRTYKDSIIIRITRPTCSAESHTDQYITVYRSCRSAMLLSTVCINDSSNMVSRTSATAPVATSTALVLVDVTSTIPK